jgi:hypothetical protein
MRRFWMSAACLLALGAVGCSDDDNGAAPNGETTSVSLLLTDAPGDVQAAVVTISEIYLQGGPDGRTTLLDDPVTVNLIDLANETIEVLNDVEVEQGTYDELRFVISGAYIEVETENGTEIFASSPNYDGLPDGASVTGELQMPSLGTSGLKVHFDDPLTFTESEQTLLVDFDVSQSFGHQAGNSGRWIMHPVVNGGTVTEAADVTVSVSLASGVTLPAGTTLAAFKVKVGNEELALTDDDANGTFEAKFQFLFPGTYPVSLVVPAGLTIVTDPVLPVDLELDEGESATQAISITSVTTTP